MSKLFTRFEEDRHMRDTARAVLMADIAHAKTAFSAKGVADRIGGRIGDGAKDVFEVAKVHSDDNRGIIAALIGAVLLWLAREPIMEILGLAPEDLQDAESPEGSQALETEPDDPDSPDNLSEDNPANADINPSGDDDER